MMSWQERAVAMADRLAAQGVLDPAWRAAFTEVPRHVFVPAFLRHDGSSVDGGRPEQREAWLTAVYRDESLTTQQVTMPGTGWVVPTSSSTRPSMMARMLAMLDVSGEESVLEVGTGTGYNAGLLAHRLGANRVSSIDIDAALVSSAAARLREVGLTPSLTAGDGAFGWPERAPFDRVLATCAVPQIPGAWVEQLSDGGVIVADVRAETSSTLVTLTKTRPGTARGRFHAVPGLFMWLRPTAAQPLPDGRGGVTTFDFGDASETVTDLDPAILDDPDFGFQLALHMPDIAGLFQFTDPQTYVLRTGDGSLAKVDAATRRTTQAGARAVWNEVEEAARRWSALGRPERTRFGLTATSEGTQRVWLDDPNNSIAVT